MQECRSDASLRSSDDSFDYEEQGERMQVCPEDTEGFVNVNCRGAPTVGESKANMQAALSSELLHSCNS